MSGRHRRQERDLAKLIAKEQGITPRQAKKKYVTRAKDMSFLDNF